jgi:hypothetical protein
MIIMNWVPDYRKCKLEYEMEQQLKLIKFP